MKPDCPPRIEVGMLEWPQHTGVRRAEPLAELDLCGQRRAGWVHCPEIIVARTEVDEAGEPHRGHGG